LHPIANSSCSVPFDVEVEDINFLCNSSATDGSFDVDIRVKSGTVFRIDNNVKLIVMVDSSQRKVRARRRLFSILGIPFLSNYCVPQQEWNEIWIGN
jgi:hypothetical protein